MAVTALPERGGLAARSASPRIAVVLSICAAALCVSVAAIIAWLAVAGIWGLASAFNYFDPENIYLPLFASIYVTALALPPAAVVGILAAVAVSDARIFGSSITAMRSGVSLMGSVPTVVSALAAACAAAAFGVQPTLTGAAVALGVINMPLMMALAMSALTGSAPNLREAAAALGASPMYVVRHALLPGAGVRLGGAILIVATQMFGGAAAVALFTSAIAPRGHGWSPVGAWPLAVTVWTHGTSSNHYGVAAIGALVLTIIIWLLQGVALLRHGPMHESERRRR